MGHVHPKAIPIRTKGTHVEHAEHGTHAGHSTSAFLTTFWISLVLSIPISFYSEMAKEVFTIHGPEFSGWQYGLLFIGSIVYFYCGRVFLLSAYREIQARLPGMMTLIAIAITAAYLYSVFSVLSGGMHELLFELASLITIMLLGHWIEMKSVQGARGALKELSKLLPDQAEVIRGHPVAPHWTNATEIVPLSELKVGELGYRKGDRWFVLSVAWGFVEVQSNQVRILAETAERAHEIDIDRATRAKERAEERIARGGDDIDYRRALVSLERALIRIQVSRKAHHTVNS